MVVCSSSFSPLTSEQELRYVSRSRRLWDWSKLTTTLVAWVGRMVGCITYREMAKARSSNLGGLVRITGSTIGTQDIYGRIYR